MLAGDRHSSAGMLARSFTIMKSMVSYFFFSFLSLYTASLSFEYYRQVYFVHSGLQDESLQVTISKLPQGSFTCTRGDSPCTGDIQLMSRSEGQCTYLVSSLQMTLEKACSDTEIFLAASGDRTWGGTQLTRADLTQAD